MVGKVVEHIEQWRYKFIQRIFMTSRCWSSPHVQGCSQLGLKVTWGETELKESHWAKKIN